MQASKGEPGTDGKSIKIGLLGLGTVGSAFLRVLDSGQQEMSRRLAQKLVVQRIAVRDLTKQRPLQGIEIGSRLTDDPWAVVNDPEIQIVVEVMGGEGLTKELVSQAIRNGKSIITANKALLAKHGSEIFALAETHQVALGFEAAVAGGIPIIKALREGLAANRMDWLAGIVNGTCNYILSEMKQAGVSFAAALQQAQTLGYAEADPSLDIDGIDAAQKLSILAAIAFGVPIRQEAVYVEGIRNLEPVDMAYAAEFGYDIKLIALAKKTPQTGIELRVHPTLVKKSSIMASVTGAMNALMIQGDAVGPTFYYGAGAGGQPTASALIADLVDIARDLGAGMAAGVPESLAFCNRVPNLAFLPTALNHAAVLPMAAVKTAYYLRLCVLDRVGALAEITQILAQQGISIEAMLQREPAQETGRVDLVIFTHQTIEEKMNLALAAMEKLAVVSGKIVRLRRESV